MSVCVICERDCVPMADYEAVVCLHCDDEYERILLRAQRTPDGPVRRGATRPHGTHAAFSRHKARGEAPCPPCVIGERSYQSARHKATYRPRPMAVAG